MTNENEKNEQLIVEFLQLMVDEMAWQEKKKAEHEKELKKISKTTWLKYLNERKNAKEEQLKKII